VDTSSIPPGDGILAEFPSVVTPRPRQCAPSRWHRQNPLDPNRATRLLELAISHYFERNYEHAAKICREEIRQYPNHRPSYRFLLASLGQLGKQAECKALMEIAPAGHDHYARHRPPWFGLKDFEHMLEGLRKAGWSE
jgi:hypothetical protein